MCRCKFVGRFAHFHSEQTFLILIVSQNGGAKDMENSLAEVRPDLAREWSDRNIKLTPDDVSYGSTINVWWKGACGHEWVAPVCNRLRQYGAGCPYCAGRRLLRGCNDLATKFPDVAAEWSEKKSPSKGGRCAGIFKSKGVVAGEVWPRMACSYRRQVKRTWLSLLFIEEGSGRV